MANFLWHDTEGKHKYHLSNWYSLAQTKKHGDWGIPDIGIMNLCLLASWINRYHISDEVIWKNIIDFKYNSNPNYSATQKSPLLLFGKGSCGLTKAAQEGIRWKIGDGKTIRFWEDWWFGNCSLATQFWDLYIDLKLFQERGQ